PARPAWAGLSRRIRDGRPHVTLKLAVSADGKAGLAGGRPVAITGERARDCVHMMRAQNDAILIGIGTALADDPLLTCRLPGLEGRSPVRVVLDSKLTLPLVSRLVETARGTPLWVVAGPRASAGAENALREHGVEVLRIGGGAGRLDVGKVLALLADRGITRLMVEGGPAVAASFVAADLVDEAVLRRARRTIGAEGVPALDGLPLTALTQSKQLRAAGRETLGDDLVERYERV